MTLTLVKVEFAPESPQHPEDGRVEVYRSGNGQIRTLPFTLLLTFTSDSAPDGTTVEIRIRGRDVVSQSCDELVFINGEALHRHSFQNLFVPGGEVVFDIFDVDNKPFANFSVLAGALD